MRLLTLTILLFAAATASAGRVAQSGDIALRHDIQVLADYGVISGPVTTWPISWDALAADLQAAVDGEVIYPNAVVRTMQRLIGRANREALPRSSRLNYAMSAAAEPMRIRSFGDTPREEAQASVGYSWASGRFSLDLNVTGAYDPMDDQEVRADGSRLAVDLGNVTFALSTMDRWWGPGWDGSLILTNNARPIPAISIGRNRTQAFESKWLSWIGPWDLEMLWGQMEDDRAISGPRFFGMRFAFRPLKSLEIGLSRTAIWCGDTRPCGFDTFTDIFIGKDNLGDSGATFENEPSDQLAGIDLRWSNMWFGQPMALYGQAIGEDEAGGFPSRHLLQFGIDTSGYFRNRWSYRWYAEWAGTSCDALNSEILYNCAYNHTIYKTGYRYRGSVIGHAVDNDARVISTGVVLVSNEDVQWQALLRFGDLNRAGAPDVSHSLTATPLDITSFDLTHSRNAGPGRLQIGLGYQMLDDKLSGEDDSDVRAFVTWRSR